MSQKSCFADTGFSHDDDGNVQSHPLGNEAYLEEIVDVDDISWLDANIIELISWDVPEYPCGSFFPFFRTSLFKFCDVFSFKQLLNRGVINSVQQFSFLKDDDMLDNTWHVLWLVVNKRERIFILVRNDQKWHFHEGGLKRTLLTLWSWLDWPLNEFKTILDKYF